jgi:uncharacterized membrane protein YuzA (DUF378 family)
MGKVLPTLIYALVTIAGLMALWSLVQQPMFGLSMANLWSYMLAIGAVAWGALKFAKFDLVAKLGVF